MYTFHMVRIMCYVCFPQSLVTFSSIISLQAVFTFLYMISCKIMSIRNVLYITVYETQQTLSWWILPALNLYNAVFLGLVAL